jgi:hypothetical protein
MLMTMFTAEELLYIEARLWDMLTAIPKPKIDQSFNGSGMSYLNDHPDTKGSKVIIVDNDHINPWNSDPNCVWKNFMRG